MELQQEEDHLDLTLSLAYPAHYYNQIDNIPNNPPEVGQVQRVSKRNKPKAAGKSETIPAPYPWTKQQRAMVHTYNHLLDNGIYTISGQVKCTTCNATFTEKFYLQDKAIKTGIFIQKEKQAMQECAPERWCDPRLVSCGMCNTANSCKPVISAKKRSIDWLFLFLGGYIGCCTLVQLKYFCKHNKIYRTAAKNRLIYSTYIGLFNQLDLAIR